MLRLLVLLLVLANAGYFAWSQGLLADYGYAPTEQAEPQRLNRQIHPEALQLLNSKAPAPAVLAAAPPSVPASGQCLQAGLFNDAQASALRTRLATSLPDGSWTLESGVEPGRWIIYMGRYANEEALVKKRSELRQRGVSFEALQNASLNPGLSLGHFGSEADAEAELAKIAQRGVRTARVMQERAETRGHTLKLTAVDPALRTQLDALKPQLEGKALQACT